MMSGGKATMAGKVCLVTGATRGVGKGIAIQLGQAGATVYITGRTLKRDANARGSLEETAHEIERRGGRCIPMVCDHSKDEEVQHLFEKIEAEQQGRLDVLVNNAFSAVSTLIKCCGMPLWEQPLSLWDDVNNVGLRNHYLCIVLAMRLMVPRMKGLVVNISSLGGLQYSLSVPYGVGKVACDRMAADCAVELREHNIAVVSLWPGLIRSDAMHDLAEVCNFPPNLIDGAESPEYVGKAVVCLSLDENVMSKSGRVLITADLGSEYGFKDVDGKTPDNFRSLNFLLSFKNVWFASFVPRCLKIPRWVLHLMSNRF